METSTNIYYTPAAVVAVYTKLLRYAAQEKEQLLVRGVYQSTGQRAYSGIFYDQLRDEQWEHTLTLKVPQTLRHQLVQGQGYGFRGVLERAIRKDGTITIQYLVLGLEEEVVVAPRAQDERLWQVLEQYGTRGKRDVTGMLRGMVYRGERPRIAMVYGEQGIVDQDVYAALREGERSYELIEFRVNMTKVEDIGQVLEEINEGGYHLCALVRGGGSGLEIFSHPDVVEGVLRSDVPIMAALGHVEDRTMVEVVADMCCPTPTALGVWLRGIVEKVVEEREQSRSYLLEELQKQFGVQIAKERELWDKERELLSGAAGKREGEIAQQLILMKRVLWGVGVLCVVLLLYILWGSL